MEMLMARIKNWKGNGKNKERVTSRAREIVRKR